MLLSFHFITNIFETSAPVCCLVIRWHFVEFGVLFPHFWSCEGATSLSSALYGWDKVAQHTGELIDGNLKLSCGLKIDLVELRGKNPQEFGRDHRVPIKGSQKSSAHVGGENAPCEQSGCSGQHPSCAVHPWKLLLHPPMILLFPCEL